MLGVIQEQHAERCQLYAQWKNFEWPIVQDATTFLNLDAVPVVMLLDEHGVVRHMNPRSNTLEKFIKTKFEAPKNADSEKAKMKTDAGSKSKASKGSENKTNTKMDAKAEMATSDHVAAGNKEILWRKDGGDAINAAIKHYSQALKDNPKDPRLNFYLGVAYRARFDSDNAEPEDFDRSVENWTAALKANPNQYIWRRRLEQYGPRMEKPYPFSLGLIRPLKISKLVARSRSN